MRNILYKGYEIVAKPIRVDQATRWRVYIDIYREERGWISTEHFGSVDTYHTEEEAIERCFEFGRQILDGQLPEIPSSRLP
jgi:hypothetical protein